MKILFFILLSFFLLLACDRLESSDQITIEGDVKGIPDGKIYLTEAHQWRIHLDSTICKNGHFRFMIKPDSVFYPYMASLMFPDSSTYSKYNQLFFINEFVSPSDTSKYKYFSNSGFYLQKGTIKIVDADTSAYSGSRFTVKIKAGNQNEAFYRNERDDFGWLGNLDSLQRLTRVNHFKNRIKQFPYSYYLLECILNYKEQYSKKELEDVLMLFTDEVRLSKLGENTKSYIDKKLQANSIYTEMLLMGIDEIKHPIIDTAKKLNMLIFWASWCGPCRMEIPKLKKVYERFNKQKGFRMVSISLDEDAMKWETALGQENMPWQQLIIDAQIKEDVKERFTAATIPCIVFTDNQRRKIAVYLGYDADKKNDYDSLILESLSGLSKYQ